MEMYLRIGKLGMLVLEWELGWGETEGCTGMQVNTDDAEVD